MAAKQLAVFYLNPLKELVLFKIYGGVPVGAGVGVDIDVSSAIAAIGDEVKCL
jgi:hypothetical protein